MSVLFFTGYESGSVSGTAELAPTSTVGTVPAVQTSGQRTGIACARAAANVQSKHRWTSLRTSGLQYTMGGAFKFTTNFPSANTLVMDVGSAQIRVSTTGLAEFLVGGAAQSGSVQLVVGTWHYLEIISTIVSGGNDTWEAFVDGTSFSSKSGANDTDTLTGNYDWGPNAAYGASRTIDWDDIYVSDDQGSAPVNARLGPVQVDALMPTSDISRDTGWTDNDNTTTNLFNSVDNTPPVGVLPASGAGTADLEIKNAASTTTENVVFALESMNTAGVPSGNTILGTAVIASGSLSSATSATNYSLEVLSTDGHPAVTEANFDPNSVGGAWPSGWKRGALAVQDSPTITDRAVSPQVEVGKRTATTRVIGVAHLRIDVLSVEPGAATNEETGATTSAAVLAGADVHEAVEAGANTTATVLAGADVFEAVEAAATSSAAVLGGVAEVSGGAATYEKTGATTSAALTAGADVHENVEAGAVVADTLAAATDSHENIETGSVVADTLTAGADVFEAVEAGATVADTLLAGTSAVGGGTTYNKTGDIIAGSKAAAADAAELGRAGATVAGTLYVGTDVYEAVEAGAIVSRAVLAGFSEGAAVISTDFFDRPSPNINRFGPGAPGGSFFSQPDPEKVLV